MIVLEITALYLSPAQPEIYSPDIETLKKKKLILEGRRVLERVQSVQKIHGLF